MADIQLSDMINSYPNVMTPGLQTLITAKREFAELSAKNGEILGKKRGSLFNHQKMTLRYLRAYKDLIILSETGTGKSCEVMGFTEYTRKELAKGRSSTDPENAHFKHVMILVRGKAQQLEIYNQLGCRCSDGSYEQTNVTNAKNEKAQRSALKKNIGQQGYTVITFKKFYLQLLKLYGDNLLDHPDIIARYSDSIFWIDEAHNLLVDTEETSHGKEAEREKVLIYQALWQLLHTIQRSKCILSTATPMINSETEIGSLLNLILPRNGDLPIGYDYRTAPPADMAAFFPHLPAYINRQTAAPETMAPYFQAQFPANYPFGSKTLHELEPFFRGRIAYIRATNTGAVPVEKGELINQEYTYLGNTYLSQLTLLVSPMSHFQSEAYKRSRSINGDVANRAKGLRTAERQASNFVFPDGYWGFGEHRGGPRVRKSKGKKATAAAAPTETGNIYHDEEDAEFELPVGYFGGEKRAFSKYVTVTGDNFKATPEFARAIEQHGIDYFSCKYASICRLIQEAQGNCFVYSYLINGSGSIALALCLESLGFERYVETSSIFTGVATDTKPICAGSADAAERRQVRPTFEKKLRYAFLTKETQNAWYKYSSMMETMNSYENRHGEYIKVFIASGVGREGISVNNVVQIHLVGGEWNQSNIYQALSRGIRATSHDDLILEERERLAREGENPENARIEIEIYKHVAAYPEDEVPEEGYYSTVDFKMFFTSEGKDHGIKRIMRILKQVAVGCHIHYRRNVRDTDVNYSPTCDYELCRYECVDPTPTAVDSSTYDIWYADEVVDLARDAIVDLFTENNIYTLAEMQERFPDLQRKYLIRALEKLISGKVPLTDRFGYTCYLREDYGTFCLDRNHPTVSRASVMMAYYTQGIIALQSQTLAQIVQKMNSVAHQETVEMLERGEFNSKVVNAQLEEMTVEEQERVLEQAFVRSLHGDERPYVKFVLCKYKRYLFTMHEPVTALVAYQNEKDNGPPKRGRKAKEENRYPLMKITWATADEVAETIPVDTDTPIVHLHILDSQNLAGTRYANGPRYRKADGDIWLCAYNAQVRDWEWRR